MPGTADNFQTTKIQAGPGRIYAGLAVPGAGQKLKIHTDGTPDSTQNPSAVHIGMTDAGSKFTGKPTIQKFYADEFAFPIKEVQTVFDASFSGTWIQVMDFDVLAALSRSNGTRADGAGYQLMTLGSPTAVVYDCVALIFPLEEDSTRFGWFQIYKAVQTAGFDLEISRKKLAGSPFTFEAAGITSRAIADQVGAVGKQLSVGS